MKFTHIDSEQSSFSVVLVLKVTLAGLSAERNGRVKQIHLPVLSSNTSENKLTVQKMYKLPVVSQEQPQLPLPKKNYGNDMAKLGPYVAHMWEWYGKFSWWYGTDVGPNFGKM